MIRGRLRTTSNPVIKYNHLPYQANSTLSVSKTATVEADEEEDLFREFWDLYGLKQSIHSTRNKWSTLSDSEKRLVFESIPIYNELLSNSGQKKAKPWKYLDQTWYKVMNLTKEQYGGLKNTFEEFWDTYNVKQNHKPAKKQWDKLSDHDKDTVMQSIPIYKAELATKGGKPTSAYCYLESGWYRIMNIDPPKNEGLENSFAEFWDIYNKKSKVGAKYVIKKRFTALTTEEGGLIIENAKKYVAYLTSTNKLNEQVLPGDFIADQVSKIVTHFINDENRN